MVRDFQSPEDKGIQNLVHSGHFFTVPSYWFFPLRTISQSIFDQRYALPSQTEAWLLVSLQD